MKKNISYFIINLSISIASFIFSSPIFILFLIFSVVNLYKIFNGNNSSQPANMANEIKIGLIGLYEIEGEKCFGLYIILQNRSVFIDIKEDKNKNIRVSKSMHLFKQSGLIEKSIISLKSNNEKYKNMYISDIGLHSDDINRAEVFWFPDGYNLLKLDDFTFCEA